MPREQTSYQVHEFILARKINRAPSYCFVLFCFTSCFSVPKNRKGDFPGFSIIPPPKTCLMNLHGVWRCLLDESEGGEENGKMYLIRGPGAEMESNEGVGGTQRPLENLELMEHEAGCQGKFLLPK